MTILTGNDARLANCARISSVLSVDPSSQTTSSFGNVVCSDRLRSCSSRNRSPLYVVIAIEIITMLQIRQPPTLAAERGHSYAATYADVLFSFRSNAQAYRDSAY